MNIKIIGEPVGIEGMILSNINPKIKKVKLEHIAFKECESIEDMEGHLYVLQKKGEWIRITQGAMPEQYICPFCHRTVEAYGVEELLSIRYPYCHCGADMRGEHE